MESKKKKVQVVGPGKAGCSLGTALERKGWIVQEYLGKTDDLQDAAQSVDLLVIATPDEVISTVSRKIQPNPSTVIAHLSGVLGLDVLAPHNLRMGLHPLASLPNPERGADLLESGIWFGRALDEDKIAPFVYPHFELQDPWVENRERPNSSLQSQFGLNPFTESVQGYDFRPKKGSVFIDNGKVIEGINDGQEEDFYHGESFSGQNRGFVGEAPDIGPYEYGDSVYWIPGYRYNFPSIPIPRDGKQDVPLEYGLAWNYPWAENYIGVSATVNINGPGISQTQTFDYPKNVLFVNLLPNSSYNWSVTVQGIAESTSGENWTFTTTDKIYPLNDRSIDINVQDSTYLPSHMQHLIVSAEDYTFLKFYIPIIIDTLNTINLDLTPSYIEPNFGGLVLYQFSDTLWTEKLNESNIGFSSFENLTPLDTIFSFQQNIKSNINIKPFITNGGLHSFALGAIDSSSYISFYSKENLTLEGDFNSTVPDHNSGYATNHDVWPSISFELQDNLKIKNNLLPKAYALHQNFPNPFNPITIIHFDLPKESNVKISVYDILGRSIKELVNEKQSPGFKSIKWEATNNFGKRVSAGIYIYSIEAENFRQTKKMVLLK